MKPSNANKTTWPLNAAAAIAILLAAFVVYWPAVNGGFLWDDNNLLWDNVTTVADDGLLRCWVQPEETDYWPLTASAFWLQYRLWGTDSTGYHIVNIVLHAMAALLVWRTLLRLKVPGAWLAAMLFAVHPACVLSVAWISELKNTLSIVFFVLAMLFYLRSEDSSKRLWYAAAISAFLLALTAKTSTIMLPVLLLAAAWWRRGKISKMDLLRTCPFFALSGIFAATTIYFQYNRAIGLAEYLPQNFLQRICIAGRALWTYLQTSLLPIRMPIVYSRWAVDETSLLQWIAPAMVIIVLATLLIYRRSWGRPILAAFGYMLIVLFPVLGFFNMSFMHIAFVSDHMQYLAIPAAGALVAAIGWRLAMRGGTVGKIIGAVTAAIIIGLLSFASYTRASAFRTPEEFWSYAKETNPRAWIAYNNLAMQYKDPARYTEALDLFNKAIELKPNYPQAYNGRALAHKMNGNLPEAIADYDKAIELAPPFAQAYHNRAIAHDAMGNPDKAIADYDRAILLRPRYALAYLNRGLLHAKLGQQELALADCNRALELNPRDALAWSARGNLYAQLNDLAAAIRNFTRAVELDPKMGLAYYNRALAHQSVGSHQLAVDDFTRCIELQPANTKAYVMRAHSYGSLGLIEQRIGDLQAALQLARRNGPPQIAAVLTRILTVMDAMPEDNTPATTDITIK